MRVNTALGVAAIAAAFWNIQTASELSFTVMTVTFISWLLTLQ